MVVVGTGGGHRWEPERGGLQNRPGSRQGFRKEEPQSWVSKERGISPRGALIDRFINSLTLHTSARPQRRRGKHQTQQKQERSAECQWREEADTEQIFTQAVCAGLWNCEALPRVSWNPVPQHPLWPGSARHHLTCLGAGEW